MTRLTATLALLGALLAASPAQAATDYCHLRHVPVARCDRAAQVYRPQAGQVPQSHLDMVARFEMWDRDYAMSSWPSMVVKLPRFKTPPTDTIAHETAHVVAATLGLNAPYAAKFWRDGKPVGRTTSYGKTNPNEDLAECSAAIVLGKASRCDSGRIAWLRERMFSGTKYGQAQAHRVGPSGAGSVA